MKTSLHCTFIFFAIRTMFRLFNMEAHFDIYNHDNNAHSVICCPSRKLMTRKHSCYSEECTEALAKFSYIYQMSFV